MSTPLRLCTLLVLVLAFAGCDNRTVDVRSYATENENDYYHLAKIFIMEGRFEEAADALERAAEMREQRDPEHDVDLAYCHLMLGYRAEDREDAVFHYQRSYEVAQIAASKRPELADPHAIAGYACLELGDYSRAISSYRTALGINPSDAKVHWNLGEAYRLAGNTSAARDSYTNAAVADTSYASKVEAKLQELR